MASLSTFQKTVPFAILTVLIIGIGFLAIQIKDVQANQDNLSKEIKLIQKTQDKNNANLTIVVYPWPGQIYRNDNNYLQRKIWGEWSKINNIDFIDLTSVFLPIKKIDEDKRLSIIDTYFLPQDMHLKLLVVRLYAHT